MQVGLGGQDTLVMGEVDEALLGTVHGQFVSS